MGSLAAREAVRTALDGLVDRLQGLQAKGLRKQSAWVLFRTYVNGASNHVLRACLVGSEWCRRYEDAVAAYVEGLLGATLDESQREQLWLSLRHGGLGLGSARLRCSAAYLASWEQCFSEVAKARGHSSAQAMLAQAPQVAGPWRLPGST